MVMKIRRIERDPQVGTTYIYFEEIKEGEAVRQVAIPGGMIFDFAKDGMILGIEILNAELVSGFSDKSVIEEFHQAGIPLELES